MKDATLSPPAGRRSELKDRAKKYENEADREHRGWLRLKRTGLLLAALGAPLITWALLAEVDWLTAIGVGVAVGAACCLVLAIDRANEERSYRERWREAELACDLLGLDPTPDQCKAE